MRRVVEGMREERAADATVAARGASIDAGRERLLDSRLAVQNGRGVDARQMEAEDAGHIHELHVVGGFDRHHMLVHVVGVGAVRDVVVAVDPLAVRRVVRVVARVARLEIKARVGPVEWVLVDLRAAVDDRLGDVVDVHHVNRTGDGNPVGRGRTERPGVEQRLQAQGAVEEGVEVADAFGRDPVA